MWYCNCIKDKVGQKRQLQSSRLEIEMRHCEGNGQMGSYCSPLDTQAECWKCNAVEKFSAQQPGMWYSTLDIGYCGLHTGKDCTWRVVAVEKRVSLACRNDVLFSAAENINTTRFDACLSRQPGLKRNSSDPCWIGCFYKAVLGPDSDRPLKADGRHGATGVVAGIPLGSLTAMWEQAFDNETAGGCKPLPPVRCKLDRFTDDALISRRVNIN